MRSIGRGFIWGVVLVFFLFGSTVAMAATDEEVAAAIAGGQAFLMNQQTPATYDGTGAYTGGGYWTDNEESSYRVFATAAAVAALLDTGVARTDQHIKDGINYLKSMVQANGAIYTSSSRATYENGMAIYALALYDDPGAELLAIAQNALDYFKDNQVLNAASTDYGGWGYSPGSSSADLSNTQFGAMGLYFGSQYLGLPIAGQEWATALFTYLKRSSAWNDPAASETWNDQSWASGKNTLGTHGYFSYQTTSDYYNGGPMTGAGIWAAYMIGQETHPMVSKAISWFGGSSYTWAVTAGSYYGGGLGSYYYGIFALAKGLAAAVGTNTQIGGHNWVQDLKDEMVDNKMLTAAGKDTENYWNIVSNSLDGGTAISTAFVLMTLSFADPNTPSPTKRIADDLDNPIKGTVTLSTENGVLIAGAIRQPVANAQKGITVQLPIGAMSFTLLNMPVGGCTDMRVDIPAGALDPNDPESFILPNGRIRPGLAWFKVIAGSWKGNANIPIQIVLNDPNNPALGGYILVTLCDGGPGDEDGLANGQFKDPGAPGVGGTEPDTATTTPSSSSSGGSGCFVKTAGSPAAGGALALALVFLLGLAAYVRRR